MNTDRATPATMGKIKDSVILFIAQGAYSGRFPAAPGTAGTVVAVLLYLLVKDLSPLRYGAVIVAVLFIGTWAAGEADRALGTKDGPSIVIDEIAGFLLALFMVPFAWGYLAAGFLLFRFFDILKPWPLRKLQDIPGGPGVMLDDLGAGVYTNAVLHIVIYFMGKG